MEQVSSNLRLLNFCFDSYYKVVCLLRNERNLQTEPYNNYNTQSARTSITISNMHVITIVSNSEVTMSYYYRLCLEIERLLYRSFVVCGRL